MRVVYLLEPFTWMRVTSSSTWVPWVENRRMLNLS